MLTKSLITLIQRKAPEWSDENVREIINEIQKIMLEGTPLEFTRVKDTATGKDPLLTTTSTTFEYEISTADSFPADAAWIHSVYSTDPDCPVTGVRVVPATPSSKATLIFDSAPSGQYYVWYYKKTTEILSVSTQLTVPPQYHLDTVYEGVLGMIEQIDNGASVRWEKFEQRLLPKFKYAMNYAGAWEPNPDYLRGY